MIVLLNDLCNLMSIVSQDVFGHPFLYSLQYKNILYSLNVDAKVVSHSTSSTVLEYAFEHYMVEVDGPRKVTTDHNS